MFNPFTNVPKLHKHIACITMFAKDGCQIILPVKDERDIPAKSEQLKAYLNSQPEIDTGPQQA